MSSKVLASYQKEAKEEQYDEDDNKKVTRKLEHDMKKNRKDLKQIKKEAFGTVSKIRENEEEKKARLERETRERRQALKKKLAREKEEEKQRKIQEVLDKTKDYFELDHLNRRKKIGYTYFGDHKDIGKAWYQHGKGKYLEQGKVVYEGTWYKGQIHGQGQYTYSNGDKWIGPMRRNFMHGVGKIIFKESGEERLAIYHDHKRICWLDEMIPGTRIELERYKFKEKQMGTLISEAPEKLGKFNIRLDNGNITLINLADEKFRICTDKPPIFVLDLLLGDTFSVPSGLQHETRGSQKSIYHDEDEANDNKGKSAEDYKKNAHNRCNFYHRDLGQKEEKRERKPLDIFEVREKYLPMGDYVFDAKK